jgi:ATP-binding cassette subfamily B protein
VVERGHHQELLATKGLYADMWAKQQEAREVEAHLQKLGEEAIIPP